MLTLFLFSSCQKEDFAQSLNSIPKSNETEEEFENLEGETVIGERKENPFKTATMRQAYANLGGMNKGGENDISIRTTHLYIKFLPQDTADVSILNDLERKNELNLFDYPLDCDVLVPGISYHDPNVPEDIPTPQYTAVEVGYQLPDNIDYEILDDLYLPETDLDSTIAGRENWLDMLEAEAFKLTGNEAELYQQKSKFKPSGYMRVENNFGKLTTEPVIGLKITARRWFTIRSAHTNYLGRYLIVHNFKGSVNYQMKFTNNYCKIKNTATLIAYKDGPYKFGSWNYTSWRGMKSYLWKIILRGVYDWHITYAPHYNLPTPPYLKIRGKSNPGGLCHMINTMLSATTSSFVSRFFNDIIIGGKNERYYRIYQVTVHELAHSVHWKGQGSNNFNRSTRIMNSKQMVREGWACGFTDFAIKYKFGNWYYNQCNLSSTRTSSTKMVADRYPRMIGQDLWDNSNQYVSPYTNCDVLDLVHGIPLNHTYSALHGVGTVVGLSNNGAMTRWRNNIKAIHPAQAWQIDTYFAFYQE